MLAALYVPLVYTCNSRAREQTFENRVLIAQH